MRINLFWAIPLALVLTACRTHYEVTLNNASHITTSGKPRLKDGYYVFKDAVSRKEVQIPAARVIQIEALPLWGKSEEKGFNPAQHK